MAILPINQTYTDKDFAALRDRLFDLIRSVFPDWSVDAVANFGNILVESYAFVGDVLTFSQDQQAREARWGTVTQRRSAIALAKLIGYELSAAQAASADVTVTITNASALTGTVTPVASAVVVRTNEVTTPVRGELDGPVSFNITGGETSKSFTWRHRITAPSFSVASTNRPDQAYHLPSTPFLWGSEAVSTSTDGDYVRVDNFLDSLPTDKHYRIQLDQNDAAQIIFGDGRNGKIPAGTIAATYKTGGGAAGNVEQNSLVILETQLVDSAGNTAYATVTNPADAEGGVPREEVAAARVNAPASLRVLTRTVAREDYEINARRVAGVGRALMLTSNEYVGIGENRGQLFIIPSTGGTPSQALRDAVYTMCTQTMPNTITFQLDVLPVVYKAINVDVTVWLRPNVTPSVAKAAIVAALEDLLDPMLASGVANPNVDFGFNYKDADGNAAGEIAWSDLFNAVRDVSYVRKVDQGMALNGSVTDVTLAPWEFPALGTVTVRDGLTGNAL